MKNSLFSRVITTGLTAIILASCTKSNQNNDNQNNNDLNKIQYNAPSISYINKTVAETTTEDKINKDNPGYVTNMDNDAIPDFAIMRGNELYFRKGNGDNNYEPEVKVLTVTGDPLRAYCVKDVNNDGKGDLVIFDQELKGYHQLNLGINDKGIPYFGDMEAE